MTEKSGTLGRMDGYNFRARLQPALLTLLPLAFGSFAWLKPEFGWLSGIWTGAGTCGLTFLLATWVRARGHNVQERLWNEWGGPPTTQLLRHAGPANRHTRERWHMAISKLLGRPLPTLEEERTAPDQADEVYEAAVQNLIGRTRDKKAFPLIYTELVNYGFCRNTIAMKPLGIAASVLGCLAAGAATWNFQAKGQFNQLAAALTITSAAFLVGWVLIVCSAWARVAAFSYASRLLESAECLSRTNGPQGN